MVNVDLVDYTPDVMKTPPPNQMDLTLWGATWRSPAAPAAAAPLSVDTRSGYMQCEWTYFSQRHSYSQLVLLQGWRGLLPVA